VNVESFIAAIQAPVATPGLPSAAAPATPAATGVDPFAAMLDHLANAFGGPGTKPGRSGARADVHKSSPAVDTKKAAASGDRADEATPVVVAPTDARVDVRTAGRKAAAHHASQAEPAQTTDSNAVAPAASAVPIPDQPAIPPTPCAPHGAADTSATVAQPAIAVNAKLPAPTTSPESVRPNVTEAPAVGNATPLSVATSISTPTPAPSATATPAPVAIPISIQPPNAKAESTGDVVMSQSTPQSVRVTTAPAPAAAAQSAPAASSSNEPPVVAKDPATPVVPPIDASANTDRRAPSIENASSTRPVAVSDPITPAPHGPVKPVVPVDTNASEPLSAERRTVTPLTAQPAIGASGASTSPSKAMAQASHVPAEFQTAFVAGTVVANPTVDRFDVQPAATTTATESSQPLPDDLPRQIVQAIRMQWTDGAGEAHVKLQPQYLGEVSVAIRVEHGDVTATLQASAPEVRQWMESHEAVLRQGLAEHGLRLERLVIVDERPASPAHDDEQQEPSERRKDEQPRRRPQPDSETTTFEVVV